MEVCFKANLHYEKWLCCVPLQISTGFPPRDETRSFSVDIAAKGETAGFLRKAFRPGFWGVPNNAIFQSEGFFDALQRADRTTPTHKQNARHGA